MHGGDSMPLSRSAPGLSDAAWMMSAKGFGCVGVADESGALAGIADGNLRRHKGTLNATVDEVIEGLEDDPAVILKMLAAFIA
jgi:arabinose-5-phosphate isomerase